MGLLYRSKNFVNSFIDSISEKVHDYNLKKEYKKIEEEKIIESSAFVTYRIFKLLKKYSYLKLTLRKSFGVGQISRIKDFH